MKYPSGVKKEYNKIKSYDNRGMDLEDDINVSNEYYLLNDIAIIYKKPTPIQINKVDFKSRHDATITEAHFKIPSTTDYNGIYKGRYIDFEVKETNSLTSFPLNNIHKHQIEHLKRIMNHGGIGFIIVKFTKLNKTYILYVEDLLDFINSEERKSIPVSIFNEKGILLKEGINPRYDYLKIIDERIKYEKEIN